MPSTRRHFLGSAAALTAAALAPRLGAAAPARAGLCYLLSMTRDETLARLKAFLA
jgi:hypothetical protein